MTLRRSFRPLRPDLDKFLFAAVEDEIGGIPLIISMISAFTRLGLDPWQEAGRLSSLARREAVEQLAQLIAEIPGIFRPAGEAREIADRLVGLLPKHDDSRAATPQIQIKPALQQTEDSKAVAILACRFCARGSRAGQRNFHGGSMFGFGVP